MERQSKSKSRADADVDAVVSIPVSISVQYYHVAVTVSHRALMRACVEAWSRLGSGMSRVTIMEKMAVAKLHGICGLGVQQLHGSTQGTMPPERKRARVCQASKQLSLTGSVVVDVRPPYTLNASPSTDTGTCYVCGTRRGKLCCRDGAPAFVEFKHRRCGRCAAHDVCLLCDYIATDFATAKHAMASPVLVQLLAWLALFDYHDTVVVYCATPGIVSCVWTLLCTQGLPVCDVKDWSSRGLSLLQKQVPAPLVLLLSKPEELPATDLVTDGTARLRGFMTLGSNEVPSWLRRAGLPASCVIATLTCSER